MTLNFFLLILIIPVNLLANDTLTKRYCTKYKLVPTQECSSKKVHLTFDDGPNTTTTPKIVEALKRQNTPATFFISTHQLEKGNLSAKKRLLQEMIKSDFTIASHGHDHNCYDYRYDWQGNFQKGYDDNERRNQIQKSINLLNNFTNGKFSQQELRLIRFPYGRGISPSEKELSRMINDGRNIPGSSYSEKLNFYRANSPAMSIASEFKLDHIFWNMDSKDATSTYNSSNKLQYINDSINKFCSSSVDNIMSLFHDTRAINSIPSVYSEDLTILDEIIMRSKCLGIQFISMRDSIKIGLNKRVLTKSYSVENMIENSTKKMEKINTPLMISCFDKIDNSGQSCTSKTGGVFNHCEGISSFCINGKWITSEAIKNKVCYENLSSQTAQIVSSSYLNKKCKQRSKRQKIGNNEVSCYCQENAQNKTILKWNCFFIGGPKPQKIN